MDETLWEFCDSRGVGVRVDRTDGIVRGVKILGLESRNGRTYLPEALAGSVALYEGAKVNVNHPKGHPQSPRDYQDRMGVMRNVAFRPGEGLFGDFRFNPKHALAEQLAWDAEHAPENVGFSHNVQARVARRGESTIVEAITRVQSVDLVADPATTQGLFESASGGSSLPATLLEEFRRQWLAEVTFDDLRSARPDLTGLIDAATQSQLARLKGELDQLRSAESLRGKRQLVRQLLAEYKLPDPDSGHAWARSIVSDAFLEALLASPDEAAMRALIVERAQLVRSIRSSSATSQPLARDQQLVDEGQSGQLDTRAFVRAIT